MPEREQVRSVENYQEKETAANWASQTRLKLEVLAAAVGEGNYREERHWGLIEQSLESFYSSQIESKLTENLEEQTAQIYDHRDQAAIGAQMRGYFFEDISRHTPLSHDLVINYLPAELEEADPDDQDAFRQQLSELTQKTVFEMKLDRPAGERIAWDKGAMIAKVISQELPQREGVFVYVPALDKNFEIKKELLGRGEVVICFNPQQKTWVAEGNNEAKKEAAKDLVLAANEINVRLAQAMTVPDAIVLKDGQPVGAIETKCWQTEEVAALVDFLRTQPEGAISGGPVKVEHINWMRREVESKPNFEYQGSPQNLNLVLKLAEEIGFIETSLGRKLDNPLTILRLPGNVPPDEIEELQGVLHKRGFRNLLIQQLLLSETEVETIAKEYIHSESFRELLENRFAKIQAKPLKLKNIKARALALGVDLNDLINVVPNVNNPSASDRSMAKLKADYEKQQRQ